MPDPRSVTAMPNLLAKLDGEVYRVGRICKPHDCADNQFLVLFAPGGQQAWGVWITHEADLHWFGNPGAWQRSILQAAIKADL